MDKNKPDVIEYEDSENWKGSNDKLSVKEIGLRLFSKALAEGSKEMTGSGVDKRLIGGQLFEIPRPNQREVFVNSVEMAKMFLLPLIQKSKHQQMFKDCEDKIIKVNKECEDKMQKINNTPQGRNGNESIDIYNKAVEELTESYEFMNVKIHKELLAAISFLLSENKYFDEVGYIG